MEIVYITESNGYGGSEKYLIDIITAVKGLKGKVSVALPHKPQNERLRLELTSAGIDVIDIHQYRGNYLLNFLIALKFFLPRKDYLYHFSLPYPDSCRWLLLVAALLRRKYIVTELLVPADPLREGAYFFVTHLLFNILKKFCYRRAAKVIAICKEMRNTLVNKYHMPSDKITVIYTGIDPVYVEFDDDHAAHLRSDLGIRDGSFVLTSVGRLTTQKGHMYLLAALEKLLAHNPSIILLLVGDGDLRSGIESHVKSHHLDSYVRLMGFRKDIRDILSISDLFVFPSLYEGFPYMVLEAMAAGKPVIATNVGGIPEAVDEGVTGVLVPPGDDRKLCETINDLIRDTGLRREMGQKGRERIAACFSKKNMLNETLALYSVVLGRR